MKHPVQKVGTRSRVDQTFAGGLAVQDSRFGKFRLCPEDPFLGKRKHTPPCSSAELFFAEKKKVGHRGKISVEDMVFLVFIGFLYPPPTWKVFL